MELRLTRKIYSENATIGELYLDGQFECYILEDIVRDKDRSGKHDNGEKKIYGETAIPFGRYRIVRTFSNRFQRELPLLMNVPDFQGIRIHPGNRPVDTHGCLLPGRNHNGKDQVTESKSAFEDLYIKLCNCLNAKEPVYITIV